ncbi:MAG: diacylglycerol kinase family protein [Planctomycetota bacterium]
MMNTALLFNPIAGRGRSARIAGELASSLRSRGHDCVQVPFGPAAERVDIESIFRSVDVAVVAGGDGTVHHASRAAASTATPIYHYPLGTENLFARQFGMKRSISRLLDTLDVGRVIRMDRAFVNDLPFLLMCSVGYDANVVHRLARVRSGAITKLSYLPHMLREFITPHFPCFTITADGETILENQPGTAVIANSRQYAARLDPCPGACVSDAMLDICFLHHDTRAGLLQRMAETRLRLQSRSERFTQARAKTFTIHAEGEHLPVQVDGEAADEPHPGPASPRRALRTPITVRIDPAAVPVLVPKAFTLVEDSAEPVSFHPDRAQSLPRHEAPPADPSPSPAT